jgi:serine-type D-Ala-D-Ala carboxypeptidase/endopeptidase
MIRRILPLALAVAIVAPSTICQSVSESAFPSDAEIRQMLVNRIDVQHRSVGIVVGLITPQGRSVIAYGHLEKGDPSPLNGDTIFEIGSVTIVFTSLFGG